MAKTPFVLDTRPLEEASSAHAGVLATSRAFRCLGFPDLIGGYLRLGKRQRGFTEAQMIETIVLLQTIGGDCPEDIGLLAGDGCLERGLGYRPPRATALREFLELFHDEQLEGLRPPRESQRSFIFPSSSGVEALQQVQAAGVERIAGLYEEQGQRQRIATIDQGATIIKSHKRAAHAHYQGGRGYQPMVAVWAEADLIMADEFRDGNVPAHQEPLSCCRMAFEGLPEGVTERYFRGDSACYETDLLQWLSCKDRQGEPGGRIGFAVSAMMSPQLAAAVEAVDEREWKTFDKEKDGTRRQWAEVDFVPSERYEHKSSRPLRYVGLRLLREQGSLFSGGSDRQHHAVVTNLDWDGGQLLHWHRLKAGTVEHVHDELKNGLAAGHMPSQRFGVNAAWLKLSLMSYNIASAIKGLCFSAEERTARFKKYRLLLVHVAGRMNRNNCVMGLRLCASAETIARMSAVWEVFELPTQATFARPLPQERYLKNAELLKEKFLWDLLTGRADDGAILQNLSGYGIDVGGPRFAVLLVQYPPALLERHYLKTDFSDEARQFVEQRSGAKNASFAQLLDTEYVIICLQGASDDSFVDLANRLHSYLVRCFQHGFRIAVGVSVESCTEIYLSHRSAVRLLEYSRLYPGTGALRNERGAGDSIEYYRSERIVGAIAAATEKGQIAQGSIISRKEEYYVHRQEQYHSRHVQAAIHYLQERYRQPISVQIVSDSVGISPTYLSTIFKEQTGVSFSHYLLSLRLKSARGLLESTGMPVHVIAQRSGFANKQCINRAFKKEYGSTPGAYREKHFRDTTTTVTKGSRLSTPTWGQAPTSAQPGEAASNPLRQV